MWIWSQALTNPLLFKWKGPSILCKLKKDVVVSGSLPPVENLDECSFIDDFSL